MNRIIATLLFTAACLPTPDDTVCLKGTVEPDLSPVTWAGAGVVNGKIPAGNYVVSSTYLKGSSAGFDTFQQLSQPIVDSLPTTDGLVAYAMVNSSACFTARTLAVWRDEAAMYRFVSSPVHVAAMNKGTVVSRGGSLTTHWSDTEVGATIEKGAQMLAEEDKGTF